MNESVKTCKMCLTFIQDVDVELRIVCEQFIQSVSESLIAPLSAFLTKVRNK